MSEKKVEYNPPTKPDTMSLDKIDYIPPVRGTCDNCKSDPICKYKEEMQQLADMVKKYSRADRPYRIKIQCNYFENRKCGAINFYNAGDLGGGDALRGNPKTGNVNDWVGTKIDKLPEFNKPNPLPEGAMTAIANQMIHNLAIKAEKAKSEIIRGINND